MNPQYQELGQSLKLQNGRGQPVSGQNGDEDQNDNNNNSHSTDHATNALHLRSFRGLKASRSLTKIDIQSATPVSNDDKSKATRKVNLRLHSQYSMPASLNTKVKNQYNIHHSMLDQRIINCQLSIAAHKDFSEEVRALLDVRKFVSDSFILTDVAEVRICEIVECIIDRLVECRHLGSDVAQEAKSLLFVERSSLSMVLANTMQGLYKCRADGRLAYDNSWIVASCSLTTLHKRQVAITRFPNPVNFGRHSQEVRFLIIVLAPNKEKMTKSAWETGRTFATMFTDINFRRRLLKAKTQDEFKMELLTRAETLARENEDYHSEGNLSPNDGKPKISFTSFERKNRSNSQYSASSGSKKSNQPVTCSNLLGPPGSGLYSDIKRRAAFYWSDYMDGICGDQSLYKTISTTIFLYFSVLLPCIAFGVVDTNNTNGRIDPIKTVIGQTLGGLAFAVFSGQPLVVIMTTAPLCIYVKVIYQISQDLDVDFGSFYACVGLWMSFFLFIMSIGNISNLMKFCTRSTEDIFALFTAIAFGSDGVKEAFRSFHRYYSEPECYTHGTVLVSRVLAEAPSNSSYANITPSPISLLSTGRNKNMTLGAAHVHATYTTSPLAADLDDHLQHNSPEHHNMLQHHDLSATSRCQREICILFLFLMVGTLFLANSFSSFNKTPYLSSRKREIIKDYALAISVIIFSFVGSFLFADIHLDVFEFGEFTGFQLTRFSGMSYTAILLGAPLGFMLSILFYIDQNICGAMVNNAPFKLRKGDYFHLDLLVLAIINSLLSVFGLPWMQGKLPHSHLHSKALADYEERVDDGHVHQTIVGIRETRLTGILCSLCIGTSLYAIPYPLSYIPLPVLSGVFLYTAVAEFKSNSMVERICLLFTEQAAYPPNHYIRRCPQRKIHFFTLTQLIQLAIVCFVGFYPNPYVNMSFPLIVATFVPIRAILMPYLINPKNLNSLDGPSLE